MLNRAADTERKKNFRFDVFARLSHKRSMVSPSGINHRPGGADIAAQKLGQLLQFLEFFLIAHTAATANNNGCVLNCMFFFDRTFILHKTNARFGQSLHQRQTFDQCFSLIIMRNFFKCARPYCGHLGTMAFRNNFRQHVAAKGRSYLQQ